MCFHELHGALVERDESVRAQPLSFISYNAVGIITAVVALKTKVATTFQKVGNAVGS